MKIFFKIFIFSVILIWLFYFFIPWLFKQNLFFWTKKIDIKKYVLTPDVWKIYLLNLNLISLKNSEFNSIKVGSELFFKAIDIFNTNIIELLDTNNKNIVLNTHIKQIEQVQSELSDIINNINNISIEEQTKSQEYLQQKEKGDTDFANWFITKDWKIIIDGLQKSYENGPKYIQHRILSNAWKILVWKLEYIKTLIDAKLILLQNNSDMIINNYEIIKWDLLWKLLELKQRLESNMYNQNN